MKRLLPILTAAFALAATTVVAQQTFTPDYSRYYYDYYSNPTVIDGGKIGGATEDDPYWYTDTVQYKDFEIARTYQMNDSKISTNFYRIHITGDNVKLYLTDWVNSYYSDSNSLAKRITEYGYRVLNADGTIRYDENNKEIGEVFSMPENPGIIDTTGDKMPYYGENTPVNRYEYSLGTFVNDTVIELYMKGVDGIEAYSYNSLKDSVNDDDKALKASAQGGYSDGYTVVGETIDSLVKLYPKVGQTDLAAKKAMPLAGLDVLAANKRVYFGIYGEAVGSPLPGGLPIALIAGLFGLGFWYIRRRKAVAA